MPQPRMNFHSIVASPVVNVRCPYCHRNGTFHAMTHGNQTCLDAQFTQSDFDGTGKSIRMIMLQFGVRMCPNTECNSPLFVVRSQEGISTYPVETIDFDAADIPDAILASFEEAIKCHANLCFKAAAIMVRRTLEEVCRDRGATGADLKRRIAALSDKVVLPKELLEAADELRLLGTDAAHMEAQVYDDVGKEEVEVGIALCKEILKGVYQLAGLVNKLRKLRSP